MSLKVTPASRPGGDGARGHRYSGEGPNEGATLVGGALRRPLCQLVVLFAGGNTPLDQKVAQFGRSVAHRFNDAGIDMFINTDLLELGLGDPSSTPAAAQIKPEHLSAVISASYADFLIVIGDRNMRNETVQARRAGRLVEMPLEERIRTILESWAAQTGLKPAVSGGTGEGKVSEEALLERLQRLTGAGHLGERLARLVATVQEVFDARAKLTGGGGRGGRATVLPSDPSSLTAADTAMVEKVTRLQTGLCRLHREFAEAGAAVRRTPTAKPARPARREDGGSAAPKAGLAYPDLGLGPGSLVPASFRPGGGDAASPVPLLSASLAEKLGACVKSRLVGLERLGAGLAEAAGPMGSSLWKAYHEEYAAAVAEGKLESWLGGLVVGGDKSSPTATGPGFAPVQGGRGGGGGRSELVAAPAPAFLPAAAKAQPAVAPKAAPVAAAKLEAAPIVVTPVSRPAQSFAPARGSWTCDTCTLLNGPGKVACDACGRPAPASASEWQVSAPRAPAATSAHGRPAEAALAAPAPVAVAPAAKVAVAATAGKAAPVAAPPPPLAPVTAAAGAGARKDAGPPAAVKAPVVATVAKPAVGGPAAAAKPVVVGAPRVVAAPAPAPAIAPAAKAAPAPVARAVAAAPALAPPSADMARVVQALGLEEGALASPELAAQLARLLAMAATQKGGVPAPSPAPLPLLPTSLGSLSPLTPPLLPLPSLEGLGGASSGLAGPPTGPPTAGNGTPGEPTTFEVLEALLRGGTLFGSPPSPGVGASGTGAGFVAPPLGPASTPAAPSSLFSLGALGDLPGLAQGGLPTGMYGPADGSQLYGLGGGGPFGVAGQGMQGFGGMGGGHAGLYGQGFAQPFGQGRPNFAPQGLGQGGMPGGFPGFGMGGGLDGMAATLAALGLAGGPRPGGGTPICKVCGNPSSLSCGECESTPPFVSTYYCGPLCQRADFAEHRKLHGGRR